MRFTSMFMGSTAASSEAGSIVVRTERLVEAWQAALCCAALRTADTRRAKQAQAEMDSQLEQLLTHGPEEHGADDDESDELVDEVACMAGRWGGAHEMQQHAGLGSACCTPKRRQLSDTNWYTSWRTILEEGPVDGEGELVKVGAAPDGRNCRQETQQLSEREGGMVGGADGRIEATC